MMDIDDALRQAGGGGRRSRSAGGIGQSGLERWVSNGGYSAILQFFGGIAIALFSFAAWLVGANLTITFVGQYNVPFLPTQGQLAWVFPIAFTVIEVSCFEFLKDAKRRNEKNYPVWAWLLIIVGLDIGTTFGGAVRFLSGWHVPFFVGFDMPKDGPVLVILSLLVSGAIAFGPEWATRGGVHQARVAVYGFLLSVGK